MAGGDLAQRCEWLLQEEPLFTLVHAAAYNGQVEVLRYLRQHMPPSFFREVDAEGSNALHTLLESSRDMDTARFLLEVGVDGFAVNKLGRSPLSMAIEVNAERDGGSVWTHGREVHTHTHTHTLGMLALTTDGPACLLWHMARHKCRHARMTHGPCVVLCCRCSPSSHSSCCRQSHASSTAGGAMISTGSRLVASCSAMATRPRGRVSTPGHDIMAPGPCQHAGPCHHGSEPWYHARP